MTEMQKTEGGGSVEYNNQMKKEMVPRNMSPEMMGRHKAMVFRTVMAGGFSANAELAGWDGYSADKKKLLISGLDSIDDVRYVLNVENDNDILAVVLGKKRELETLAQMAAVPVK